MTEFPRSPRSACSPTMTSTWSNTSARVAASARRNRWAGPSMMLATYSPPGRRHPVDVGEELAGGEVPRRAAPTRSR